MRKRNVFPSIIILAFYGILWSKVRKMTYLHLPFGMDELYVWWLKTYDHILRQVADQEESWIERDKMAFYCIY